MKRFALFLLIVFAACSSDNGTAPKDPGGGGGGGGGGAVTHIDSLRVEAMQDFAAQLDLWDGMSADSIAVRAAGYLSQQPLIKSSGITPGETTVWAVFTDGVSLIFPNNRNQSAATDTLIDDVAAQAPSRVAPPRRVAIPAGRQMMKAMRIPSKGLELPAQPTFRAVNAIGSCFVNPLGVLKMLLRKGHYVNAGDLEGSVDDMKKVRGNGIFYLDTHGGVGKNDDGIPVYGLWTTTTHEWNTLESYNKMLHNGDLVIMTERGRDEQGKCRNVCHYGITAGFVAENMSFGKNSLVFIDACSSASAAAFDMQQAFKNNGASLYLGWTTQVDDRFAYKAMKYLFDRLLGTNEISPEDPKQRAFNIDQVLNDMKVHRQLTDDPYKNAVLTPTRMNGDFGLLSPTIQFLSVDETPDRRRLIIAGLFGTDPGEGNREVTINDVRLDNVEWFPSEINCDLPDTGSNASGTVVVKVGTGDDARISNPVNLTEWKGEWTYDRDDPGSQTAQMKISLRFRADIHSFRDEPGEEPFETTVLFGPSDDSRIEITTGGEYSETIADCTDTYTLGQGGKIESVWYGSPDGLYVYFGSVDTKAHQLRLAMQVLAVFTAGTWKRSGDCENFSKPLYVQVATEDCLFDDHGQATAFLIPMNNDFEILKGERGSCSVTPLVTHLGPELDGQAKIRWNDITPFFLPDPDAAR